MTKKPPFHIALFVDGFTLKKVNEYYRYYHPFHSRLDFRGIKNWARKEALRLFSPDSNYALMECHYYHPYKDPKRYGGNTAGISCFERELRYVGFQVHYAENPSEYTQSPNMGLMQDALLFSSYRKIDAVILFSSQGQFAPLPDKLKSMGIPTLLLGWNFTYPKDSRWIHWKTDYTLRDNSAYYIAMDKIANNNPPAKDAPVKFFNLAS